MVQQRASEERRTRRVAVVVRVKAIHADEEHYLLSENLSVEGIFLNTIAPFPLETELILEFELPVTSQRVVLRGVVQRINPTSPGGWRPGMGIRFTDYVEGTQSMVRQFVEGLAG